MTDSQHQCLSVLILGAGMSGILAGIHLKQEGIEDFEILDMASDVGGTWRDNTYPGLSCDVPAHSYDYSFEPNWSWQSTYATGAEIQAYFKHCAAKYGLTPHLRLETRVIEVVREHGAWTVISADGVQRRAQIVINALGVLVHPLTPALEGLEQFAGARFHSARWDHSVTLDGRRIGIIGTGSTASQIVCALAGRASHLDLYQRTAQWVCPNFDSRRPEWLRQLYRRAPVFSTLTGGFQTWLLEYGLSSAVVGNRVTKALVNWLCRRHLARVRDPELRARLTPDYAVGCRRLIFSDQFYDAIQQPNVELVTSGIARIEAEGLRTQDGVLHPLDVLVLATGFHALDYMRGLDVRNEQGESLAERWTEGAQALRSVTVAGFANFFMLIGPHSPIGNFPLTAIAEIQFDHILPLIRQILRGEVAALAPKPEAEARYNEHLRAGFGKTQWVTGCKGWYLNKNGLPGLYPYTPAEYRRDMRSADLAEYDVVPT